MSRDLIISRHDVPPVALGMTGASFDAAQHAGITRIEADAEAMCHIARHIGFIGSFEPLPPLVLVTRDSSDTRKLIGRWDDRLPTDQSSPTFGRFFPANALDTQRPPTGNRDELVQLAKAIGAPALTEVSIASWAESISHVADFATGLLLGQRPLDLLPKRSGFLSAVSAVRGAFGDEAKSVRIIKELRQGTTLPEPFAIVRTPEVPQIER